MANPGGGPSYLVIALRIDNRGKDYISAHLQGAKESTGSTATATSIIKSNRRKPRRIIAGMRQLLNAASNGALTANCLYGVMNETTAATGTIACTQANAAGDTLTWTFGDQTVVLTEGTDFARGASDTTCATALAAAINANQILNVLYTATSSTGTVTLTSKAPGGLLKMINITTSDGTAFAITAVGFGTYTANTFMNSLFMNRSV